LEIARHPGTEYSPGCGVEEGYGLGKSGSEVEKETEHKYALSLMILLSPLMLALFLSFPFCLSRPVEPFDKLDFAFSLQSPFPLEA